MGMFSWFTQDTNKQIAVNVPMKVIMTDDKGNQYTEYNYDGYGVFGDKDYYVLLAEMNGLKREDYPTEDAFRDAGIDLAFDRNDEHASRYPMGDNPNIKHPSLTENGDYYNGLPPKCDPNQGWCFDECVDEEDYYEE